MNRKAKWLVRTISRRALTSNNTKFKCMLVAGRKVMAGIVWSGLHGIRNLELERISVHLLSLQARRKLLTCYFLQCQQNIIRDDTWGLKEATVRTKSHGSPKGLRMGKNLDCCKQTGADKAPVSLLSGVQSVPVASLLYIYLLWWMPSAASALCRAPTSLKALPSWGPLTWILPSCRTMS